MKMHLLKSISDESERGIQMHLLKSISGQSARRMKIHLLKSISESVGAQNENVSSEVDIG